MKLNKLIAIVILVLLVCMVAWGCWNWLSPKKATPTVDLPVGDDMATQIKKGTTIYTTENVPAFVLNGTDAVTTDFSATVKVMDVLDTRTIGVEILSPVQFSHQGPGNAGYLYLCQPLSNKAEQLPDGSVVYGGDGYPQIIAGQEYTISGVLQPQWLDYPRVYIPSAVEFKRAPVSLEGPQINMMGEISTTRYDVVPLSWNVGWNTLQASESPVVYMSDVNNGGPLCWQPGPPVRFVQQWSYLSKKPLITTISKDVDLLTPPEGMQYLSTEDGEIKRWYASDENAFVSVPLELDALPPYKTLDGKTLTITEQGISSGSKAKTLVVPVPSGLQQIVVVYGSGSTTNGFILVETRDKVVANAADSLWLLRMDNGTGSWVRCGDLSAFGGSLIPDESPSFARVGTLVYFTHSHTKIGCIDTAAASPSVTVPENINTLLTKLFTEGPQNAEGPVQAQLASDNGTLI
ncbi:MAG TPA: hypothetical protein VFB98_04850, partial [Candidatus Deferrimicrobium sp.]|nr:hypothetical protein [Candidatus Deferrimicrobium sp.]